jgi:hypothetical protein
VPWPEAGESRARMRGGGNSILYLIGAVAVIIVILKVLGLF